MMSFPRLPMMARLVALFGICLFTAGAQYSCSSDGTGSIGDDIDSSRRFTTRLVLRDSAGTETSAFQRGELINFHLTIRNLTNQTIVFQGCCPPESDFFVFDARGETVRWQWSEGRPFPAVLADLVFAPNETKTFQVAWNQVTRSGEMLAAGSYDTRGIVTRTPFAADPLVTHELGSSLRTLTIR
jgi:hypothetical protein